MRNIRLLLEYDGTRFSGWQVQPHDRTVQGVLESAVSSLTGVSGRVTGASRTDAGVHALGQVANFHTQADYSTEVFKRALNAILPRDVAIIEACDAEAEFNARHSSRRKLYRYIIHNRRDRSVFGHAYSWHVPGMLEIESMQRAARHLVGTHDFTSFRSSSCESKSPVREIFRLDLLKTEDGHVIIDIEGSGFLKQMARTIAGTLVSVGKGGIEADDIPDILAACNRDLAGPTAPACGLFLVRVDYEVQGGYDK